MILDHIESPTTRRIEKQHALLGEAFAWIRGLPAAALDGITELRGREMYVNVHGYPTLPAEQCRWESHRRTIDLQYCIAGGEMLDWLPAGRLAPLDDFNDTKDTEHWRPVAVPATRIRLEPGAFVIFLPGELHRPKVFDETNPAVRKLVVKILVSLLDL